MTFNNINRLVLLPTVFILFCQFSQAQSKLDSVQMEIPVIDTNSLKVSGDTVSVVKKRHSPAKAALYSGVLPGLGQAYNKKYWKIPIVYAGFAGLGYWIGVNVKNYRIYKDAYTIRMDGDSLTVDRFVNEYSSSDIKTLKDYYRKNLDLSIILTAVWYSLNIVDAAVDAHLFEFDVSDNLSMRVKPVIQYQSRSNNFMGVKMQFALKN